MPSTLYRYQQRDPRRPLVDLSPHGPCEYYHKGLLGIEVLRLVDPERTPQGIITVQILRDL